jgi:hypothetical protein
MKTLILGLAATFALSIPAVVGAQVTTYNSAPTGGFQYGVGNDYTPANATVLTNGNNELAVRFHEYQQPASASVDGLYTFALGTVLSYDFSIGGVTIGGGDIEGASILLTNLLTNQSVNYNPLFIGNDNTTTANGDIQNSARLTFGFLSGVGFDANTNNTYRIDLTAGGNTVTSLAQFGTGAGINGAVPEPSTWAMMLIGFGAMGVSLRRRRTQSLLQAA